MKCNMQNLQPEQLFCFFFAITDLSWMCSRLYCLALTCYFCHEIVKNNDSVLPQCSSAVIQSTQFLMEVQNFYVLFQIRATLNREIINAVLVPAAANTTVCSTALRRPVCESPPCTAAGNQCDVRQKAERCFIRDECARLWSRPALPPTHRKWTFCTLQWTHTHTHQSTDVCSLSLQRQMGTPQCPPPHPFSLLLAWPGSKSLLSHGVAYCLRQLEALKPLLLLLSLLFSPLYFTLPFAYPPSPPIILLLQPWSSSCADWVRVCPSHWHSWISKL